MAAKGVEAVVILDDVILIDNVPALATLALRIRPWHEAPKACDPHALRLGSAAAAVRPARGRLHIRQAMAGSTSSVNTA